MTGFILVGGSALALRLEHRQSEDLERDRFERSEAARAFRDRFPK